MSRHFTLLSIIFLFTFLFTMSYTPARAVNVADIVEHHEEFSRSHKSGHEAKLIDKVLDAQAFCNEKDFAKYKAELVRYLEASVKVLRDAFPDTALSVAGLLASAKSLRFQKPCHPGGEGSFIHVGLPGAEPEGSRVPRSDQLRLRLAILACDKDEFERQRAHILKELEALKSRLIQDAKAGACPEGKGKCDTDEIDKVSMEINGIKGMKGPTSPPCGKKEQQQVASGGKKQDVTPGTGGQKQTGSETADGEQTASGQGETEEGYWQYCKDGKEFCTASLRYRQIFEAYLKKHGVLPPGITREWIKGPPPPNYQKADTPKAKPEGKTKPVTIGASVKHENKCRVGRACEFSFEFTNLSNITYSGPLLIYDWMPVPVTVINNSENWLCAPAKSGKVICATNVNELAPGASVPLKMRIGMRWNFRGNNPSNCVEVPTLAELTGGENLQNPFFYPTRSESFDSEGLLGWKSWSKESVELFQFGAKAAGFDPGPIDGKAGPKTRTAIDNALQEVSTIYPEPFTKHPSTPLQTEQEAQSLKPIAGQANLLGGILLGDLPLGTRRACTPINLLTPAPRVTRGQPPANQQPRPRGRNPNIQIDLGVGIGGGRRNNRNWQHQNQNPAGGIGIQISDQRLKRDIIPVAKLESGLTLYSWKYLWSETVYVGVMAQVLLVKPKWRHAVMRLPGGWLAVDYSRIGFPMSTLEAWRKL